MPLSPAELNYIEIVAASAPHAQSTASGGALDSDEFPPWFGEYTSSDPLTEIFPSDEDIMETMSLEERPWSPLHHRSSFLPTLRETLLCLKRFAPCLPS